MNELEVFQQNQLIIDKLVKELKNLFKFYRSRKMHSCQFYIIYVLNSLLEELNKL